MNFEQARFNMVEQQVRPWDVLNPDVLEVMQTVPRENFVPAGMQQMAYSDACLPIGDDQQMMKPVLVGRMLQALEIKPDEIVLEVGTGTGYVTACMAKLGAHVYSVDIDPKFQPIAEKNLTSLNISNITLATGDASKGWDARNEYDVIAVTGSMNEIPEAYKQALSIGGRLFVVTGQAPAMHARLITRVSQDVWSEENILETSLPVLKNCEKHAEFEF